MIARPADPSDEVLAARAAGGDQSAFEALVLRYQHRVFRLACRLTSETEAPDVAQEAFIQAYRHLSTFRGDARFSTWLYRIAANNGLMHRRARARRPVESLDEFMPQFDAGGRHVPTPDALRIPSQLDELMDRTVLATKIQAALDRLPDLQRDAFVLRDLEELPATEVAQILGVEPATVRQRVHRARLLMRGYLSELARGHV